MSAARWAVLAARKLVPVSGLAGESTATLTAIRTNLLAGLDKVTAHMDAGTFDTIPDGKSSPPSQAGQLTLDLLAGVDAELDRRRNAS